MLHKYFLKLDGVEGESKSPRHFGEIDLSGFTWGGNHPGGVGGGRGKASINDLTVLKQEDKTTPILWVACHSGQNFREGILTVEKISESGSLLRSVIIKLKSILIDSVIANGDVETVALNFESKELTQS